MKTSAPAWNLLGKHPSFGDFLSIGRGGSLIQALEQWMELGADGLGRDALDRGVSWRMAMPQNKTGKVMCGLLKDSRDTSGRAHPLLIAGELRMRSSVANWASAVAGCLTAWRAAEDLSMRSYAGTAQLREALELLPSTADASETESYTSTQAELPDKPLSDRNGLKAYSLAETGIASPDATQLQRILHRGAVNMPTAVFMGGTALNPLLVIAKRPLQVNDFAVLWTASSFSEQAWTTDSSV